MSLDLGWLITIPLAGALGAFLVPSRARAVALGTATLTAGATALVVFGPSFGTVSTSQLGGFAAPLGIELRVDGLTAWMLVVTALVGYAASIYGASYFASSDAAAAPFWRLWLLLWTGMNGLYLSADLFNIYVNLEIVGLTSVALVAIAGREVALESALRYLLMATFGSLAFLLGVALVYAEQGVLALELLQEGIHHTGLASLALVLMTLGMLLKTAIFPFHFWLPEAHANAPSVVSALLSALVVKASFYILVRLWLFTFAELPLYFGSHAIAALGAVALVYGSVHALWQRRLKLLIAYSTVAQLGYLCLALPLVLAADPAIQSVAYGALAFQLLTHALAKSSLFFAAGSILQAFGTDRLSALRGMARQMPVTVFAFGLASVSLVGVPPSGGFAAKWWLAGAALDVGAVWLAVVILGGGLLTATYLFRVMAIALAERESDERPGPSPRVLATTSFVLALMAVLIGVWSTEILQILDPGSPFGGLP